MIELIRYEEKKMNNHFCIVCADGWIICGIIKSDAYGTMRLIDSAVLRSRSMIDCIKKHKDDRELDEIGEVTIAKDKVLFTIQCEW